MRERVMFIAVMEDDERRQAAMSEILARLGVDGEVVIFDNAPEMIAWLTDHLSQTRLRCLDHDLGPNRRAANGEVFDPGTGRDVADFLSRHAPICPVIIHTTNGYAAPGMIFVLEAAGWDVHRVVPYSDLEWLYQAWTRRVADSLGVPLKT